MWKTNIKFKDIKNKPIFWMLIVSISWLVLGLLLGIFYDFFFLFGGKATFNPSTGEIVGAFSVFDEHIYVAKTLSVNTQLSVLHTHALVLGFTLNTIFLILEKCFKLSQGKRFFIASFILYNVGVFLVIIFMMIRGLDAVLYLDFEKQKVNNSYAYVIVSLNPYKSISSSLTAIPHIMMAIGIGHIITCIYKSVKIYVKNKKEEKNKNINQN